MDVTVSLKCEHEELKTKTIFDAAFKNITSASLGEVVIYTIAPIIIGLSGRYSNVSNAYQVTHCNTFESENLYGDTLDKVPYCDVIISASQIGGELNRLRPFRAILSADNCNWYNSSASNYIGTVLKDKIKDAFQIGDDDDIENIEFNSVTLIVKGDLK